MEPAGGGAYRQRAPPRHVPHGGRPGYERDRLHAPHPRRAEPLPVRRKQLRNVRSRPAHRHHRRPRVPGRRAHGESGQARGHLNSRPAHGPDRCSWHGRRCGARAGTPSRTGGLKPLPSSGSGRAGCVKDTFAPSGQNVKAIPDVSRGVRPRPSLSTDQQPRYRRIGLMERACSCRDRAAAESPRSSFRAAYSSRRVPRSGPSPRVRLCRSMATR